MEDILDNPDTGTQDDDLGGTGLADKPSMIEEMRTAGVSEDAITAFETSVPQSDFSKMRGADASQMAQMQQRVDALTQSLQQVVQGAQGPAQANTAVQKFLAENITAEDDPQIKKLFEGLAAATLADAQRGQQANTQALQQQIHIQNIDAAFINERAHMVDTYGEKFVAKVWSQVATFAKKEILSGRQVTPETLILQNFQDEALNARTNLRRTQLQKANKAKEDQASGGFEPSHRTRSTGSQSKEPDTRDNMKRTKETVSDAVAEGLRAISAPG